MVQVTGKDKARTAKLRRRIGNRVNFCCKVFKKQVPTTKSPVVQFLIETEYAELTQRRNVIFEAVSNPLQLTHAHTSVAFQMELVELQYTFPSHARDKL